MYDEYDDGEGGASLGRKLALGIGVVAIAAAGFFAFKAVTGGDGGGEVSGGSSTDASVTAPAVGADAAPETTAEAAGAADDDTLSAGATTDPTTSDVPPSTEPEAASTSTAVAETTTTAAPAPPTTAPPAPPAAAPYATLPDGSPQWVTAIYDTDKITLSGVVPDDVARQKLSDLARLSAKEGQGNVVDNMTTNPAVPRSVGVRVVELTSARFPEGSAEVVPDQAAELNRLVGILNGLPNVTALVIGHADQRGDEVANYVISEARADAVTNYLASQGVNPARLSSRAVGENDLLTLNNDDAALALNRRTEFVLFGLLQD